MTTSTLVRRSAAAAAILAVGATAGVFAAQPAQAAVTKDVRMTVVNETGRPLQVVQNDRTDTLAPFESAGYLGSDVVLSLGSGDRPNAKVHASNPLFGAPYVWWQGTATTAGRGIGGIKIQRQPDRGGATLSEGEAVLKTHPSGYTLQISRGTDGNYKELRLAVR